MLKILNVLKVTVPGFIVFGLCMGSYANTETTTDTKANKSIEIKNEIVKHPCHGISGAPYKKYLGFKLDQGTILKYKSIAGNPKN